MSKTKNNAILVILATIFWWLWLATAGTAGLIAAFSINCSPVGAVIWFLYVSWLFKEGYGKICDMIYGK
jgi:hypothetical protein